MQWKLLEKYLRRVRIIALINNMQLGFMPGKGTINAVFILKRIQEEYLAKQKRLCIYFVDQEKAFYRVWNLWQKNNGNFSIM